jgi:hypothetical protein
MTTTTTSTPTTTTPTTTANRRVFIAARVLGHGFALEPGEPDFGLPLADFDAALAARERARGDSWPGIDGWPRLPSGEARWETTSWRTRIRVLPSGDVHIATREAGFGSYSPWGAPDRLSWMRGGEEGDGVPDGTIIVRGRAVVADGRPSATAWQIVDAICIDEDIHVEPQHAGRWIVDDDALSETIRTAPLAVPAKTLSQGAAAVEAWLRAGYPFAARLLDRLRARAQARHAPPVGV